MLLLVKVYDLGCGHSIITKWFLVYGEPHSFTKLLWVTDDLVERLSISKLVIVITKLQHVPFLRSHSKVVRETVLIPRLANVNA